MATFDSKILGASSVMKKLSNKKLFFVFKSQNGFSCRPPYLGTKMQNFYFEKYLVLVENNFF